ncbi:PREDICTED: geranylgeranyl transferase type-2 subunit alpha-like isoform X2 [Priapulus caudatus]|uniref:Geranylgeranyl transferase type-2 subunit alpha n=1 Tax=Priapulus caudatus TaxID=37621 RepID=A0ABM1EIL6_PRICU|nr:PREDICTED: geranylgeranyl transferase type-2 subunit alpha-like isoform X1 [Priapulus caudatus]XP_014672037.1 PREDICTED: geranylgeranyl transferase type-2 subunit alpha-like isoform X2 [Priapulus caudatus]
MHGRLKVRTTAEQQEIKRKERAEKVKKFQAGLHRVFQKRDAGELDAEALQITAQLLAGNPDVSTLWNYRRAVLQHYIDTKSEDEVQAACVEELDFLESCLRVNPKSYGVWHHRAWTLSGAPRPDWTRELQLCDKFLEYDERNFHCWDHRRFVVKCSGVSAEAELEFTDTKISTNFSNYSSWYYRSKLLPIVHPATDGSGRVAEAELLKEFQLVQNAFFTDPNDQSAWFYHRWLLGKGEQRLALDCIHISRDPCRASVRLTKPVKLGHDHVSLSISVDGKPVEDCRWKNATRGSDYGMLWTYDVPRGTLTERGEHVITAELSSGDNDDDDKRLSLSCTLPADRGECKMAMRTSFCRSRMTAAKTETLTDELESCKQLDELEPNNKWALLTIVLLMRALDPLGREAETLDYLSQLSEVDPYRGNYYRDLGSKFIMENVLEQQQHLEDKVALKDKGLTALYYTEYLATVSELNLASNKLTNVSQCCHLQCVTKLILDDNELESCVGLGQLPLLVELSLQNNKLSTVDAVAPLSTCPRLERLDLRGNPMASDCAVVESVRAALPQVRELLLV